MQERISSEEQLSSAERSQLAADPVLRSLIEENRLLEQARPRVWQAPQRSQMLRQVYQKSAHGKGILSLFSMSFSPQRLRALVGSAAMLIILCSAGLYLQQYSSRWQRSDGFEISYRLQPDPGSDLQYFTKQLAGEASTIGESRFGRGSVELLAVEPGTDGMVTAVLRLRNVSPPDLVQFDAEFSGQRNVERTGVRQSSWFSNPRQPGQLYESRLVTINSEAALFPQQFSLSEVRELDQLLQLMNGEDELYIRGMSLGDGRRFSLGEVVSLEMDADGNLTIEDSAGKPADGSRPLEFNEVVSGEGSEAD